MLPYNKSNLYQNIGQLALIGVYCGFAIFAVRIFFLKRNFLWKVLLWLILPLLINAILAYDGRINESLIIASIFLIPLHWFMMFAIGYCMTKYFEKEKLNGSKRNKNKKKTNGRWGNKEYTLLGILLILIAVIIFFWNGYITSNETASDKRRFGIVWMDEEQYVVIDANESKMILQKCKINKNILEINYNTYLCVNNNMVINFITFDYVKLISD